MSLPTVAALHDPHPPTEAIVDSLRRHREQPDSAPALVLVGASVDHLPVAPTAKHFSHYAADGSEQFSFTFSLAAVRELDAAQHIAA